MDKLYNIFYLNSFFVGLVGYPLHLLFSAVVKDDPTVSPSQSLLWPLLVTFAVALAPLIRMKRYGLLGRGAWEVRITGLVCFLAGLVGSWLFGLKAVWNYYLEIASGFTDSPEDWFCPILLGLTIALSSFVWHRLNREISMS